MSGKTDEGLKRIDEAKLLRKGRNNSFEAFYPGVYYFFQEQPDRAIPLLEQASTDPAYAWSVTIFFAVLYLDHNQPKDAERLMQPYAQAEVTECDHGYVVASLDLLAGKQTEAKMLVDKFESDNLLPFWKSRFDRLRAKIQTQNP